MAKRDAPRSNQPTQSEEQAIRLQIDKETLKITKSHQRHCESNARETEKLLQAEANELWESGTIELLESLKEKTVHPIERQPRIHVPRFKSNYKIKTIDVNPTHYDLILEAIKPHESITAALRSEQRATVLIGTKDNRLKTDQDPSGRSSNSRLSSLEQLLVGFQPQAQKLLRAHYACSLENATVSIKGLYWINCDDQQKLKVKVTLQRGLSRGGTKCTIEVDTTKAESRPKPESRELINRAQDALNFSKAVLEDIQRQGRGITLITDRTLKPLEKYTKEIPYFATPHLLHPAKVHASDRDLAKTIKDVIKSGNRWEHLTEIRLSTSSSQHKSYLLRIRETQIPGEGSKAIFISLREKPSAIGNKLINYRDTQKGIEEANNAKLIQLLLHSSEVAILVVECIGENSLHPTFIIRNYNQATIEHLGKTDGLLELQSLGSALKKTAWELIRPLIIGVSKTGQPVHQEMLFIPSRSHSANGSNYQLDIAPIDDACRTMVIMARPIDSRERGAKKHKNERMNERLSAARDQKITELTSETFIIVENGIVTWASQSISANLNYAQETILGKSMVDLLTEKNAYSELAAEMECLEEGERLEWRDIIVDGEGVKHWGSLRAQRNDQRAFGIDGGVLISIHLIDHQVELEQAATTDELTGLANRRGINKFIREHPVERRKIANLCAVFIDIDDFKSINDTHGHSEGDAVLIETAKRLRQVTRTGDFVARYSGDEFLCILKDIQTPEEALLMAERIHNTLFKLDYSLEAPKKGRQKLLQVRGSVGTTLITRNESIKTAIDRADQNMYAAKRSRLGIWI